MTSAGFSSSNFARASAAVRACATMKSAFRRYSVTSSATEGSSSTTTMRAVMAEMLRAAPQRTCERSVRSGAGLDRDADGLAGRADEAIDDRRKPFERRNGRARDITDMRASEDHDPLDRWARRVDRDVAAYARRVPARTLRRS